MKNIKLVVAYDGTDYKGFQRQTKWPNTIQSIVELTLSKIFDNKIHITGAGRTDAGVHATGQVINFKVSTGIPVSKMPQIINKQLPMDIQIISAEQVAENFHARRNARWRRYEYLFYYGDREFPGIDRYMKYLDKDIDLSLAQTACQMLHGSIDCSSFMTSGSSALSTIKEIRECVFDCKPEVELFPGECKVKKYVFKIEADSFLYNMVRIIAANVLRVASKEMSLNQFENLIKIKNRKAAGKMLPSNGLYLTSITYKM